MVVFFFILVPDNATENGSRRGTIFYYICWRNDLRPNGILIDVRVDVSAGHASAFSTRREYVCVFFNRYWYASNNIVNVLNFSEISTPQGGRRGTDDSCMNSIRPCYFFSFTRIFYPVDYSFSESFAASLNDLCLVFDTV